MHAEVMVKKQKFGVISGVEKMLFSTRSCAWYKCIRTLEMWLLRVSSILNTIVTDLELLEMRMYMIWPSKVGISRKSNIGQIGQKPLYGGFRSRWTRFRYFYIDWTTGCTWSDVAMPENPEIPTLSNPSENIRIKVFEVAEHDSDTFRVIGESYIGYFEASGTRNSALIKLPANVSLRRDAFHCSRLATVQHTSRARISQLHVWW